MDKNQSNSEADTISLTDEDFIDEKVDSTLPPACLDEDDRVQQISPPHQGQGDSTLPLAGQDEGDLERQNSPPHQGQTDKVPPAQVSPPHPGQDEGAPLASTPKSNSGQPLPPVLSPIRAPKRAITADSFAPTRKATNPAAVTNQTPVVESNNTPPKRASPSVVIDANYQLSREPKRRISLIPSVPLASGSKGTASKGARRASSHPQDSSHPQTSSGTPMEVPIEVSRNPPKLPPKEASKQTPMETNMEFPNETPNETHKETDKETDNPQETPKEPPKDQSSGMDGEDGLPLKISGKTWHKIETNNYAIVSCSKFYENLSVNIATITQMTSDDSFGHDSEGLVIVQKKIPKQTDINHYKKSMEMTYFGPTPDEISRIHVYLSPDPIVKTTPKRGRPPGPRVY